MLKFFRKWFFPFFLIFTILAEPSFHAFCFSFGISVESGMLSYVFIGIFIISSILFINDCKNGWHGLRAKKVITFLVLVLFLYLFSSLFQSNVPDLYYTYLLVFGSKCIPACLIGMHISRDGKDIMRKVDILLPYYILFIGLPLAVLGFQAALAGSILKENEDTSLNYQTYSYFMSEFYVYCAYYLFFSSVRGNTFFKWIRYPIFFAFLFFLACCFMGGGRGAFVFTIIATGYIIYEMHKIGKISNRLIFAIIFFTVSLFTIVADKIGLFDSFGFQRISMNLTDDSTRVDLRTSAFASFYNSPFIGHGLGSVWWEVGFYSHNIITDVLVEAGIVGLFYLLFCGIQLFSKINILCHKNASYFFLMLMFLVQATKGMFSGYYLGLYHLWLIFGFIQVLPNFYFRYLRK